MKQRLYSCIFVGHCLLLFVALATTSYDRYSHYWSTSVGQSRDSTFYRRAAGIYVTLWTTKLSYVCQYHSKSLHVLSLSVISLSVDQADRLMMLLTSRPVGLGLIFVPCVALPDSPLNDKFYNFVNYWSVER